MIVYVTIIGIEIVVEIIQPRSPPNIIALDAHSSTVSAIILGSIVSRLSYQR